MRRIVIISVLAALLSAGCKEEKPAAKAHPSNALANVGGVFITQKDFDNAVIDETLNRKYLETSFGKNALINALVREQLIQQASLKSGSAQSEEFIKTITDIQNDFSKRLEETKKEVATKIWIDSLRNKGEISVTEDEIKDYHKKYSYEMTIRQMLLTDPDTANLVLRELKATNNSNREKRFIELAKRYSIDLDDVSTDGKQFTFMPGEFLPEIENASANSSSGLVQGFFKTSRGFHIIYKAGEKKITLKDARDRIKNILEKKKV